MGLARPIICMLAAAAVAAGCAAPRLSGEEAAALHAAAVQGDPAAQFDLGTQHHWGLRVPQNSQESVRWYRLAAAQGHAPAQNNLGAMLAHGYGAPRDLVAAHMWVSLAAAARGDKDSENVARIEAEMTEAQIAEARRMAAAWTPETD